MGNHRTVNSSRSPVTAPPPSPDSPEASLFPSRLFGGKRFIVIGGTGFLGKVWVSMFLHRFPEVEHLYLLVRAKGEQTPEARFWAEIASSRVFDPIRERHPGAAYEAFMREKITPLAGDVTRKRLGFDDALVSDIEGRVAAVVNVAGVVDFNPPLDEALEVNAFGITNLIELARAVDAPIMHTSTCYVAGYRTGQIEEVDPRAVPFPRAEGAKGARLIAPPKEIPLDRELERSHWDPQNEISECMDVIEHVRHRCEDSFRQSAFLDQAKKTLRSRGEPCRGTVLEEELATVKRKFIKDRLVEAGRERALYWGWPNIYTYTKSIGEQVLAASGVRNTIVRPAVVESSTVYPFPSWNEGINTSAPFIYMALNGQMQFPADHDVNLDIIPVDMVVSGMIGALAELLDDSHKPVYQFGATDVNPCRMARFIELIGLYKRRKWQDGGDEGNPVVNAVLARCEPVSLNKKQYQAHGAHAVANAARGVASFLDKAGFGPARPMMKGVASYLRSAARTEDKIGDIMDLFLPFVAECEWIFSCANTRALFARMPDDERALFYWEPEKVDWRQWMWDVHLPGIEKYAVPLIEEKARKETKALRRHDTLLDLLDESADHHAHAVALGMLETDGFTRITFLEWREASATTAARLAARGVRPGDRVLLSGDNSPSWAIAYFGILRAGAVAVPVDPKLTPKQLINIVASSEAKVGLWGIEVDEDGKARESLADFLVLDLDEVTTNDASLDAPDVDVACDDLASIIYTSGTTGDPKGVMLTHANFAALLAAITPLFPLNASDGVLSVLPLHHTFEFSCGLLLPMSRGARIGYIGEITSERLSEGLEKGRVSAMVGVPALWQLLERKVLAEVKDKGPVAAQAFDWALEFNRLLGRRVGLDVGRLFFGRVHDKLGGRVKYLISGGSALPKETAEMFAGLGLPLSEGYGLTEAAPVLTVAKASPRMRAGHVGKPIPGVEIKVVNPDKEGVGEVLARGPNVMPGYFGNREATDAVIDDAGWLHTGDLGKLDKRGQLVLSGRSKDVIVSTSGENVYPDDVEEMLGDVPDVDELTIVGINDSRGQEVVACLAVPKVEDGDRVAAHARANRSLRSAFEKLPTHCRPRIVQLYDVELPKTATRKVKRGEVQRILRRLQEASAPPSIDVGRSEGNLPMVQQAIAAIAGRDPKEVTAGMTLAGDLGFDSLMSMELTVALENQLGRSLDAGQLARIETVADIAQLLRTRRAIKPLATIEDEPRAEAIDLPKPIATAARSLLTRAQMGFYGKMMKPTVYGRAFIPYNRNSIVVSNHTSHLDMGFVKYALGSYGDDILSLAAQDYFFAGKWKRTYFEQLTNLQPFDRKTNLRHALRRAAEPIEQGKNVLLFPEGTRSKDGQVAEFKSTLGHLALTCKVDILPVYLRGTHESWPKGQRIPTKREISAHIGPPLCHADLARLTEGMKFNKACRVAASLAREAVITLQRGGVLLLSEFATAEEALGERAEHPLVSLFRELQGKFVMGSVDTPVTFYFSLGNEAEAKWTMRVDPEGCHAEIGKPAGNAADCVLKTSADIFTKMVREAYMPTPMEIMSGQVKSNDVSLLSTFQTAFGIS